MLHVVDADDELMWTDDHNPPTPTTAVEAGADGRVHAHRVRSDLPVRRRSQRFNSGLYSPKTQDPADARGRGRGAARLPGRAAAAPAAERERVHGLQGRLASGGSRRAQRVGRSGSGRRKQATLAFKNPKKDATFYLDVDNPGGVFNENQQVTVTLATPSSISSSSRRETRSCAGSR